jgi:cellulose synthase/poly-beta-1,6-N-acetylglucosamine synthase-like glycosyltransferase
MQSHNYSYEIIFLDDGSTDNSWLLSKDLLNKTLTLRRSFHEKFGKSHLHAGFAKARWCHYYYGCWLQDSPEEIPGLYDMITYDLVSGWKENVTILLLLKICLLNY